MAIQIEMPKLSDTMTEGTLIKWHKQVGDSIEIGDILAEVETDKATMEMEAFDEGTLTEILIKEGEKAAIGAVLAVLDGDSAGAAPAPAAATASATPSAKPETTTAAAAAAPASAHARGARWRPIGRAACRSGRARRRWPVPPGVRLRARRAGRAR